MRQLTVVVGCLLLVVTFLSAGCSTPRDDHIRSYNMQLASPRSTINVYSSSYVANKARCNPKDRMTRVWCDEAKADLARVQLAQQQELAIYREMENDPVINEQDRDVARRSVANLQGNQ
ncbi:MAG: hypothetical protein WB556_20490 [Candidatus Acidiferrum sp.]